MKYAEIKIVLIGTEGELDRPEGDFAVKHLKDHKKAIGDFLREADRIHPNCGWTLITAHKPIDEKCDPCPGISCPHWIECYPQLEMDIHELEAKVKQLVDEREAK